MPWQRMSHVAGCRSAARLTADWLVWAGPVSRNLHCQPVLLATRAVALAVAEAEAGGVVVLAPAAASFDQYPNFEKRGEDFMAQVAVVLAG